MMIMGAALVNLRVFAISLIRTEGGVLDAQGIEDIRKKTMANLITSTTGGMTSEQEAKLFKSANDLLRLTLNEIISEGLKKSD